MVPAWGSKLLHTIESPCPMINVCCDCAVCFFLVLVCEWHSLSTQALNMNSDNVSGSVYSHIDLFAKSCFANCKAVLRS